RALALDDWRGGGPHAHASGVARASDPALVPEGAVRFAVLAQLGRTYYEEARGAQAIEAWQAAIAHRPQDPEVPALIDAIATAYHDMGDSERQTESLARLAEYVEGSPWWEQNRA